MRFTVQRVGNGYIVSPFVDRDMCMNFDDTHVFATMQEASSHIADKCGEKRSVSASDLAHQYSNGMPEERS